VSCAAGARDAQVVDLDVLSSVLSVFLDLELVIMLGDG
jgi:hypothetical protein